MGGSETSTLRSNMDNAGIPPQNRRQKNRHHKNIASFLLAAFKSRSRIDVCIFGGFMKNLTALAAVAVALSGQPVFAQQSLAPTVAPAAPAAAVLAQPQVILEAPTNQNILRAGTEIPMVLREELTTKKKKLRVGQRFQMEVGQNVTQGGVTVIPAGTPGTGEITEIRNKGMWGKSGYINARIVSIRLGDRTIRVSGTFDDKGVTGTGGVVASIALIPLAGFFTTGTSAFIASGSGVKGFLDEDIAFRPAAPQVIDVPAPVTPAAPPAPPVAH